MYKPPGANDAQTLDRRLREACEEGEHRTVQELVEAGANVHSCNYVRFHSMEKAVALPVCLRSFSSVEPRRQASANPLLCPVVRAHGADGPMWRAEW